MSLFLFPRTWCGVRLCCLLVLGSLVVGGSPAAEFPTAEQLFPELDQMLRDAVEQSPRMVSRQLELVRMRAYAQVANARLLPSAGGNVQYNVQQDDRTDVRGVTSERFYYNFSVNQPLFHWGALQAAAKMGKVDADVSSNNVAEAYRLLTLEVRAAFLDLILAKAAVRSAGFDLEIANRRLDIARRRVASGETVNSSVGGAELDVNQRQLDLDRAASRLRRSLWQFARLIGRADFAESVVPEAIPPVLESEAASTDSLRINFVEQGGLEDTIGYRNASAAIEREKLNERATRTTLRPKVDATAGISQDEVSYYADPGNRLLLRSLYVGVRVNWNIFDSFATRANVRAIRAHVRQLEQERAQLSDALREQAEQAEENVVFARRETEIAEVRFSSAQGGLSFTRDLQQRGQANEDQVATAQSQFYSAELSVFGARARYLNAVAAFLSLVNADPVVNAAAGQLTKR